MARYEHLPVYRTAMELVVYLEKTVRNFSRYQKYGIGEELRTLSRRVVLLIVRANSTVDKTPVLQELTEVCEMLKAALSVAKEVEAFAGFNTFRQAAALAVNISKQSEGWLRSSRERGQNQPPNLGSDR